MPERPVVIGMMRASGKPTSAALALAHAAIAQDAELLFFNPPDVDLSAGVICGWAYRRGSWRPIESRLPDVIINDSASQRFPKMWRDLQKAVPFTSPLLGDKVEIMRRMEEGNFYADLQIPTLSLDTLGTLLN